MATQQLESELRGSIDHYTHLLMLLQTINEEIGTASQDKLQNMNLTLTELQEQAVRIDQSIAVQLNSAQARTEMVIFLLNRRENVVKEILGFNKKATAKAMGVKSLLAHEIGVLRNGQSALNGYRQQQHNQGRIVNSTS
jgi:hypothetical protein